MWDLPNVRSETLDALARAGAVEVSRDEFGELSFALRPGSTSVAISLVDTLHDCCAAAALPCEVEKWRVASRLDLVVELLRAGWSFGPVTEENDPRSLDTPLILAPEWIMGAKARLSALLRQVAIFCKGLSVIHQRMPEHYFVCLMDLENLAPIEALGDSVLTMVDRDFVRLLRGNEAAPHAPLALAAGDEALPLEDDDPGVVAALVPAVVRPTFARMPVTMELADGRTARVHFDRGSHSSGRARALTECRRHGRCRCDRFLDDFASPAQCVAWLFAWHEAGLAIEEGVEKAIEHRHCLVPAEAVEAWTARVRID